MKLNVFKNDTASAPKGTSETKQAKIENKSHEQGEVKPTSDNINLDKYYQDGYTKDTQEQNEKLSKVIRDDVLARYNIDSDDSRKEEKLAKVYLDILDDVKNEALKENLQEKANYDGNNEEFIKNVELMMAHMVHDKSSKGDIINLSEVDFSDIKYNNGTQSGTIETRVTENGIDYTIYGEDNKVLKQVSKTFDSNGMATISTYSDGNKENLISSERVYEFPKTDDEVKFKFAEGNQNTVNFKDNGNNISVEITKGMLKKEATVEKNEDGTYSYNGKQYFTIEEIASDLNKKELKEVDAFDGNISASYQGKINDCAVNSAIVSLGTTPAGRELIKNAISVDENGNMTVNFAGINRQYSITQDEFNSRSDFSSGDKEVRAIEIAWEKLLTDVKNEVLIRSSDKYYYENKDNLEAKEKTGQNITAGSYASSVYELLTGKHHYLTDDYLANDLLEQLDALETEGSRAITVGNVSDEYKNIRYLSGSMKQIKNTYNDAYGNEVVISDLHAYAIKESDTKADGTRVITVLDPYDTSKEIVLDETTFLKAFNQAYGVNLNRQKEIPPYVLA